MKTLIIMRGLPGCGKSTRAQNLLKESRFGGIILSTDFYHYVDGEYKYDNSKVALYHKKNILEAIECIRLGRDPVIIDNTNIIYAMAKPYVLAALKYGYEIDIIEPKTSWAFDISELVNRNTHGVTWDIIEAMCRRYEDKTEFMDQLLEEKINYYLK